MTLLRINMTTGHIESQRFSEEKLIGGRAMIDHLLSLHCTPSTHPLSEESLFILAPGLLAGTTAPQTGRLSVGGKSPLTEGIKEANVGGTVAHKLGRLGIKAIIIKGRAEKWKILKIRKDAITLEDAEDIVGKPNYDACAMIHRQYGENVGIVIIGRAGEMKLSNSTVAVTDPDGRPSRHAARGGLGAVMGAKGLKAVIIDDSGTGVRRPLDEKAFSDAIKVAADEILGKATTPNLRKYGTSTWIDIDNARGSLPTYNHRLGAFEKFESINARRIAELSEARGGSNGHRCMPGCLVQCSNVFHGPAGNMVTAAFEYETIAILGANLGIYDIDAIARMDRQCDDLGIDTIELGCTIGVLNDAGLFEFGDAERAVGLIGEIAKGTPLGRILGSGVTTTAKVFGIDRIPAVKGQGIPAHSARSLKGWGVTYATSPQGADHTAGAVIAEPLSPIGHTQRSRESQIGMAALDSTGFCMFTYLRTSLTTIVKLINAFYGVNWAEMDYLEMGKEALRQERAFNFKAGISPGADGLPDWMKKEPLPPTDAIFDVSEDDIQNVFNF
ncbi:MAG: aldehyde ferredoxin oxidoreductase [Deltaproteobacteria bacterium]|nr:aldehyde ferredoxin oxidoreductase [Deltaproteobacteria bacterium]